MTSLKSGVTRRWFFHIGLLVLTFATTTLIQGPAYAVTIMTILLAHELGHYFVARRYGVTATFPIFIPMLNLFGTMGAVIAMKSRVPNRRALFDIGVAGPLMGLAFAIPAISLGLSFSQIQPLPREGGLFLGEPLLFSWISSWILGIPPTGSEIFIHPIAFAGWAALFVTSINLLPVGQLDGGHMSYAIFGPRIARVVSLLSIAGMAYLGYRFHPWLFFVLILFFVLRHPPPVNDEIKLDRKRILLGILVFILMICCFSPTPFMTTPSN